MKFNSQIQIFGDSILKEVMLDNSNQHYYLPKEPSSTKLEKLLSIHIKNNSRFGCTITKGYKQLVRALDKGLNCDTVLLGYGGNDCDYNWNEVAENPNKEHLPNTPLNKFEQIYRNMIKKLKENGIEPLMMSLPPINAKNYFSWITREGISKENILAFLGDVQMIYRFQELYSNTVVKIAHETSTMLVDVRSSFLNKRNYSELICDDGIHPSEKGYNLIKQTFYEFASNNI